MSDELSDIYLPDKIGGGYGTMFRSKQRYIVIKGSRRSKKSKTQAQKLIYQLVKYPLSNALVVRRFYNTLRDSCFAELQWAIENLGLSRFFKYKESPLEIEYIPTGQKIFFRGLDDASKVTSITVKKGALCFLWVEEAFEIEDESEFDKLEESMLGATPRGHFKQITLTFNPWSESTWIKKRFFDNPDPDVLAMTTNYLCNEWLSDEDRAIFEKMKVERPDRYRVSGLGEWGVDGAVYFEEFDKSVHVVSPFRVPEHWFMYRTIDYGLDALACLYIAVDPYGVAYVVSEVYEHGLKISDAAKAILDGNHWGEADMVTYAPPDLWSRTKDTGLTIAETFRNNGVYFRKSSNSRVPGWMQIHERLKVFEDQEGNKTARLKIFSNCHNLIRCITTIKTDEKDCNDVANEPHELTHLPDALRGFCIMHTASPKELDMRTNEEKFLQSYKEGRFRKANNQDKIIKF